MYELLEMTKEVDTLDKSKLGKKEAGYNVQYYMFNNTRMQFPPFKFSQADPVAKSTEQSYCLHLYW